MTPNDYMMRPRALGPGSRVALVAPAGPIPPERVEASITLCRSFGLEAVAYPASLERDRYLAGTDARRLDDLQAAIDDSAIDGVWALRGGYGTLRILDRLDLSRQRRDPVPFIGFSDNTTIHGLHTASRVISFHGPHPGGSFPPEAQAWFRRVLFRAEAPGPLPAGPNDPPRRVLAVGRVEARLVGGNLAMLSALCGSKDLPDARGRILFLEDVGEPAYRVDRMLTQLLRAGVFEGVVGLAVGRLTTTDGTDDAEALAVVEELVGRLAVPAIAGLPFGHVDHNCVVPVGATAVLDTASEVLAVSEAAVRDS